LVDKVDKGDPDSRVFENPGIFCRKKLHEGCETLCKMGNWDMTNGNRLELFIWPVTSAWEVLLIQVCL
jgi:hypothetical protein